MKKIALLIALFFCTIFSVNAQDAVTYQQAFPNLSFEYPVEIQNAKDGSDRLFVVEQSGRIKVFENTSNTSQQQVFLDLRNQISFSAGQEIGLLGLAFHPNYSQNGYFYVYHTRTSSVSGINTEMVLARYQVGSNANQANASSRLEIFSFDKNQPHSNHNGGKIAFGPDGYLYISIGDGGGGGDPEGNSQNLNTVFGSILRIDIDVNGNNPIESNPDTPNGRYEIPSDNPRVGRSGLDELYAWGIRNTWKFSFDSTTSRLWGADVGQGSEEEINLIQKGGNYGWRRFEGTSTYSSSSLVTSPDIKPVYRYNHNNGDVSITGGYVYRGSSSNTKIQGKYIFADYVSGRVWALDYNSGNGSATSELLFRTSGEYISSFGLDESGELYFSGYGASAKIFKINGGNTPPPPPPGPVTVAVDGVGDWKELENGTNGIVEAVVIRGDDIFIGGSFSNAGGINANNLAWYNKNEGWKNLSSGANGTVYALAIASDGKLYAGGTFSSIGGVSAQNVGVWNGSSWSAVGSGTDGKVAKIGIDGNDNVYVGGAFSAAGGISVNNIARWNNGWSALRDSGTSVVGTNNEIRAIAFDTNNTLYVGGNFDSAGGRTANRIATWNGSNWGTLGTGTSGFVQAIVVTSQSVYAGGNFIQAGDKTTNRIARWVKSSSSWEPMGNGVSGNVNALDFDGTYVYAGGNFETAANDTSTSQIMKNMARWSISSGWQALGPGRNVGVNNIINDLDLSDNNQRLYVGGNYGVAGNITARNIGIWSPEGFDCTDERLITEYRINSVWSSGQSTITVDEGDALVLSILPNSLTFAVTSPSGNVANGDLDLGNVTQASEGIYTFETSGGCEITLNVQVNAAADPCTADSIRPEYRLNNGSWTDAGSKITVDEGDDLVLGIKPDGTDFTITLPNGTSVNNDHSIAGITLEQSGIYVFRTTVEGCTANLEVEVLEDTTVPCTADSVRPEYRLNNGSWTDAGSKITVDEGDDLVLGIKPDGTDFTITLPNGTSVNNDHSIAGITLEQSGIYVFRTTVEGCTANLEVEVLEAITVPCAADSVRPEYRLNNGSWTDAGSKITVDEGDDLVLGIKPDGADFTITLPNGTSVNNDHTITGITLEQSGIYVFRTTAEGCTANLEVEVLEDTGTPCTTDSVVPEYRIGSGFWISGEEQVTVDEGTEISLGIKPDEATFTIELPNGTTVNGDYNIPSIQSSQAGVYTFITAEGCNATFSITVIDDGVVCTETSIIPEYQLDGIWSSGQNEIDVPIGTSVVLSMLPNDIGLTITLPNGDQVGDDHSLGEVTTDQSGVYVLTSAEGCTTNLEMNVFDDTPCQPGSIIPEYQLHGIWSSGENVLDVPVGTAVVLSMLPNDIGLTITLPNGDQVGDDHSLGEVTTDQSGVYVLTSAEGCTTNLELNVYDNEDSICQSPAIIPEYRLNGVWSSGLTSISVAEGTDIMLSILPNNIGVEITLPSGLRVGDDYNLGNITMADAGMYLFTTPEGCTTSLNISVIDNPNCNEESITNEYRINGQWDSGDKVLNVTEGTEVTLSMLPNGVPVTITTPNGQEFGDNYSLGAVTTEQTGMYILTTEAGCISTIVLNVREDVDPCSLGGIIPEYRIDGQWLSGENEINVDEGTNVILSMLPNYIDLTITTPDGLVVGDDYNLGNVTVGQGGTYILDTGNGCTETITLNVNDLPNCSSESIISEYRLDGIWESGSNYLRVSEGTEVILSILPNNVGVTITLPDGRLVGDDYNLGNVTPAHNGIYVFTSEQGCKTTLELFVPQNGDNKSIGMDELGSDFTFSDSNGPVIEDLIAYPNPTADKVTVDLRGIVHKGFTLILTDARQQRLLAEKYDENHKNQIDLDLGALSSGIYFLVLKQTDGTAITKRIIKN